MAKLYVMLSISVAGVAVLSAGCAETFHPRPSPRIAVIDGSMKMEKDGQTIEPGLFGGGVQEAVHGNPRAEEEASTGSAQTTGGFVCNIFGLGGTVGGTILIVEPGFDRNKLQTSQIAGIALLIGGFALTLTGSALQGSGRTHFYNAINMYNEGLPPSYGGAGYPVRQFPSYAPPPRWDAPRPVPAAPPYAPPPYAPPGSGPPALPPPSVPPPNQLPPAPGLPPSLVPPGTSPVPLSAPPPP